MHSFIQKTKQFINNLSDKTKKIILFTSGGVLCIGVIVIIAFVIISMTNGKAEDSDGGTPDAQITVPTTEVASGEQVTDIKEYIKQHYGENGVISEQKIGIYDASGYNYKPDPDKADEYFIGINKSGDVVDMYNDYMNYELSREISTKLGELIQKDGIDFDECIVNVKTTPDERAGLLLKNISSINHINDKSSISVKFTGATKNPGIFKQLILKINNTFNKNGIKCSDINLFFGKSDSNDFQYKATINSNNTYTLAELEPIVKIVLINEILTPEKPNDNFQITTNESTNEGTNDSAEK